MFGEILQKFVKKTPIAVMVQGLMERLLNAEELDRWFGTARNRQYTKEITFSSLIELMLKVVCKLHPSVHSAYRDSSVSASVVAVYDKLKRLEPSARSADDFDPFGIDGECGIGRQQTRRQCLSLYNQQAIERVTVVMRQPRHSGCVIGRDRDFRKAGTARPLGDLIG